MLNRLGSNPLPTNKEREVNTMTKVEMLAKLKSHKGVGVQVETELGNEVYYFY